jgi:hypothetical protein
MKKSLKFSYFWSSRVRSFMKPKINTPLPSLVLSIALLIFSSNLFAQVPTNDSCVNALEIPLGTQGLSNGVFESDSILIDSATVNVSEWFHSSNVTAGNDKKSIWFKFYLGARRGVDIELKQHTNAIATRDAGFTTFYTNSCLPGQLEATAAKITTLNQFGSSFHPCMDPGWYYIQVSAKARAAGKLFIQITTSYPHRHPTVVNAEYDACDSAYDFGDQIVGGYGNQTAYRDFELGCYTIDDSSEYFQDIGNNYEAYNQSAWFKFTANGDNDYTQLSLGNATHCRLGLTDTFAYRLFKGDCSSGFILLDSGVSDFGNASRCYGNCGTSYPVVLPYPCQFDSGETYMVQFLFHYDLDETLRLRVDDETSVYDSSNNQPTLSSSRNIGLVSGNNSYNYGFSCGSYFNTNSCSNNSMPNSGVAAANSPFTYNLNQWMHFNLDEQSELNVQVTYGRNNNYKYYQYLGFRLFKDSITNSCGDVDTSNIILEGYGNGTFNLKCLEKGEYTIQLLGADSIWKSGTQVCQGSMHLGGDYRLYLNQSELPERNRFALIDQGEADTINSGDPLTRFVGYYGEYDTISCNDGIRPDSMCETRYTKTMYRVIKIGDSDGDGDADSGLLYISGLQNVYRGWPHYDYNANHRLYKGNALTLRNTQTSITGYPDTLTGLVPYTDCFGASATIQEVCVEPGEYTLVSFFDSIGIGRTERPYVSFSHATTKYDKPSKPEFIDTIKNYTTYYGEYDTFTCHTNPDTIDGVSCGNRNTYHVFYLDSSAIVSVGINYWNAARWGSRMSLFKGDIRNGKAGLKLYTDNRDWSCVSGQTTSDCYPMQPGWYTVMVSRQDNISYDTLSRSQNNRNSWRLYSTPHQVYVSMSKPTIIPPKFYRPSLAAFADSLINNNQPLSYDTNYSVRKEMPQKMARFNFPEEILECDLDTPMNHFPKSQLCDTNTTDIVYYTFNLAKDALVRIYGNVGGGWGTSWDVKLYDFDVRKDSARLATAVPVQDCKNDANVLEFCNLIKGEYSLIYFCRRNAGVRASVRPVLHIDSVAYSRFDFAANTYDFGPIPSDGVLYDGKPGDVHPDDTLLPASHDMITCRTGAWPSDPMDGNCGNINNQYVYSANDSNTSMFPYDSSYSRWQGNNYYIYNQRTNPHRNLWYSFVINGRGKFQVNLKSLNEKYLTSPGYGLSFSIYSTDADGSVSLDSLKARGGLDSTIAQGLTHLHSEVSCRWGSDLSYVHEISLCEEDKPRRYYVMVRTSNYYNSYSLPNANQHVWLEVKYDSNGTQLTDSKFDYYSQAGEIHAQNSRNLVLNPIIEDGFQHWTRSRGYVITAGSNPDPKIGQNALYMYSWMHNDTAEVYQDVDVSDYAAEINAGTASTSFGFLFQTGQNSVADKGRHVLEFYNSSGGLISSIAGTWDSARVDWERVATNPTLPVGTVKVRVLFQSIMLSTDGTHNYYVDDVYLKIKTTQRTIALAAGKLHTGEKTYAKDLTRDTTDHNRTYPYYGCGGANAGTAWYKFQVDSTGYLHYSMQYTTQNGLRKRLNRTYSGNNIRLFKSTVDGDSVNGLEYIPYTNTSSQYYYTTGYYNAIVCVSPGTYYFQLNDCDALRCDDWMRPFMVLDYHDGDFCETAAPIRIDTLESNSATLLVNCHTIGEGHGEDGSDMGCLFGPQNYKSSWFVVDYTDTTKVDLEFSLGEYTSAKAGEIRYRTFYGNCAQLTPAPCNNNALTTFTLDCIRKGTYYVQVVTPEDATGNITMTVEAKENTDTTCNPVDIFQPNAVFNYTSLCPENIIQFINTSSRGDSIRYLWDFGYNGATDTASDPVFVYPPLKDPQNYTVKLIVTNIAQGSSDSMEQTITVPFSPEIKIHQNDTNLCAGDSLTLTSYLSHGNGVWNTGSKDTFITVTKTGWYSYFAEDKPNLLVNGNFEHSTLLHGWTVNSGTWVRRSSSPYPEDSTYYFSATSSGTSAGVVSVEQTVDVSFDSVLIDSGLAKTSLIGYLYSYNEAVLDEGQLEMEYLDSSNNTLAVYRSDYLTSKDAWLKLSHSRSTPKNTRKLTVRLYVKNNDAGTYYYSFFDNIQLKMRSACDYVDSVYVQFNPIPKLEMPEDTFKCPNDSFLLAPQKIWYDTLYVTIDSMNRNSLTGRLYNNATYNPYEKYVTLTPDVSNQNGAVEWIDSSLSLQDSFEIHFDFYTTRKGGWRAGDAVYFYMFTNATPTWEDHNTGGYSVAFDEYNSNEVQINWSGSRRHTYRTGMRLDAGEWKKATIKYNNQKFDVYIDGVLMTSYTDPTTRTQGGFRFGIGARGSGRFAEHRVRNFFITQENPQLLSYTRPYERRYQYLWTDGYRDSSRSVTTEGWFKLRIEDAFGCVSNWDSTYIQNRQQYDSLFTGPENVCSLLDTFLLQKPDSNGFFYGNSAVDSSGTVIVDSASFGNNTIYFQVTDTFGCVLTDTGVFVVDSVPQISIDSIPALCLNDTAVQMTVNNNDGYFYGGSYIDSSGVFTPSAAARGYNKVYYTTFDTDCQGLDSVSIWVDSIPDASITPAGPFCANDSAQTLTGAVNTTGSFTAASYIDTTGRFSPATAGSGTYTVYYSFTDGNGCSNTDSTNIRVDSIPDASITPAGPYCANDSDQTLTGAVNTTGSFTAASYIDTTGRFSPSTAGRGTYTVYYAFTDGNGCSNTDSTNIRVDSIPDASITPAGPYCANDSAQTLTGAINTTGRFTAATYIDTTGRFSPSTAGRGTYTVYYSFTDGNGCSNTDSTNIRVDSIPDARITPAGPYCANDSAQTLTGAVNTTGSFTAASYIDTTGRFSPSTAGRGTYTVYYSFTDGNGCSNTDSTNIRVDSIPDASITPAGPFCANDSAQTLTGAVNTTGSFTAATTSIPQEDLAHQQREEERTRCTTHLLMAMAVATPTRQTYE